MRAATPRVLGRRLAGLLVVLALGAAPAAEGEAPALCRPRLTQLEIAGGERTHAILYRPERTASQAVVLASGTGEDCWAPLAEGLCRAGWGVLVQVPQPATGEATAWPGETARAGGADPPAISPASALGDSVEFLAVVCIGSIESVGPLLAGLDARVGAVIRILPEGEPATGAPEPPDLRPRQLLLIASQRRPASLALASDLFSGFNTTAELRLLNWGESGCELLADERQRRGLQDWLAAAAAGPSAGPAPEAASGREPGR